MGSGLFFTSVAVMALLKCILNVVNLSFGFVNHAHASYAWLRHFQAPLVSCAIKHLYL